jgi:hypothetical protein
MPPVSFFRVEDGEAVTIISETATQLRSNMPPNVPERTNSLKTLRLIVRICAKIANSFNGIFPQKSVSFSSCYDFNAVRLNNIRILISAAFHLVGLFCYVAYELQSILQVWTGGNL